MNTSFNIYIGKAMGYFWSKMLKGSDVVTNIQRELFRLSDQPDQLVEQYPASLGFQEAAPLYQTSLLLVDEGSVTPLYQFFDGSKKLSDIIIGGPIVDSYSLLWGDFSDAVALADKAQNPAHYFFRDIDFSVFPGGAVLHCPYSELPFSSRLVGVGEGAHLTYDIWVTTSSNEQQSSNLKALCEVDPQDIPAVPAGDLWRMYNQGLAQGDVHLLADALYEADVAKESGLVMDIWQEDNWLIIQVGDSIHYGPAKLGAVVSVGDEVSKGDGLYKASKVFTGEYSPSFLDIPAIAVTGLEGEQVIIPNKEMLVPTTLDTSQAILPLSAPTQEEYRRKVSTYFEQHPGALPPLQKSTDGSAASVNPLRHLMQVLWKKGVSFVLLSLCYIVDAKAQAAVRKILSDWTYSGYHTYMVTTAGSDTVTEVSLVSGDLQINFLARDAGTTITLGASEILITNV